MAIAAASRAEAEHARALAHLSHPPADSAPMMMAMSLDDTMTLEAPNETVEPLEPAGHFVTPEQPGEHAEELTPNAGLVEPIDGLTIDSDTEFLVLSPRQRASVSDVAEVPPRIRHKSAMH